MFSYLRPQSAIVFKKAVLVFQSFHSKGTVSRIANWYKHDIESQLFNEEFGCHRFCYSAFCV